MSPAQVLLAIVGAACLVLPLLGAIALTARALGWAEALLVWGITFGIVGSVLVGTLLLWAAFS